MNPLADYPGVRRVLYAVSFVVGLGLSGTQIGFAAAEAGQPVWLNVALAVYAFLAAGLGVTAASNTPKSPPADEAGDAASGLIWGACLVGFLGFMAVLCLIAVVS